MKTSVSDIHKKLLEHIDTERTPEGNPACRHTQGLRHGRDFHNSGHRALLVQEGKTDLALESNNKELIMGVCEEFIEEKLRPRRPPEST